MRFLTIASLFMCLALFGCQPASTETDLTSEPEVTMPDDSDTTTSDESTPDETNPAPESP